MTDQEDKVAHDNADSDAPADAPGDNEANVSEADHGADSDAPADAPGDLIETKRTSLSVKSAAIPVVITLLLSAFIVYPYVRNVQLFGAQRIAPAEEQGIKLTNDAGRLLQGIQEGGTLEGFTVEHLRGPIRERLEVELERGGQRLRVFVSRQDRIRFEAPRKTQMYAVYYENARPDEDSVKSEEYIALVEAVAKVVEQHERNVSMPKGL